MSADLEEAYKILAQLDEYEKHNQLEYYKPYQYQKNFHFAQGMGEFVPAPSDLKQEGLALRRGLMCANQVGKSFCGGMETAMHLTGLYPDWWEGHRFTHAVEIICSSTTNETTRDRCQRELLGEPSDESFLGTGSIPKSCISRDKLTRKAGVPNAWETALVKHVSGNWSKAYFKPYEQGSKKFMGYRVHGVWCDEEPPQDIWSQQLRGLLSTNGIAYITFTPEEGVTQVVYSLREEEKPGYALISATWDDAPHMTDDRREQQLQDYPEHEREMRSKGEPVAGSGLIYPVDDEDISCDPFPIPNHFARIIGVDLGYDHPFAAVAMAEDRDNKTVYVYDTYREKRLLIPMIVDRLRIMGGDWIPIMWPHDGMVHDRQSGVPFAHFLRDEHKLNMHPEKFNNPPGAGQKEGQGGQGVEVGLQAIHTAMAEGRFKVFRNQDMWFQEKRSYHRRDGDIVKLNDELMAATRYAFQMIRHATYKLPQKTTTIKRGLSNWN